MGWGVRSLDDQEPVAVVIAEQLLERLAERREPSARRDLGAAYSPSKASTQARPSGVMRKRCFLLLGFSGIVISIQPFS